MQNKLYLAFVLCAYSHPAFLCRPVPLAVLLSNDHNTVRSCSLGLGRNLPVPGRSRKII